MIAWILIGIYISIFLGGGIYAFLARERYKAELGFFIIIILYIANEIVHFISFNLAVEALYDVDSSMVFWIRALIGRIFSIAIFSAIHTAELHKDSKIRFLPIMIYLFLIGAIMSLIFLPNTFTISQHNGDYIYVSNEPFLMTFLFILNFFVIIILWLTQIKGYNNFSNKNLAISFTYYIGILSLNIIVYLFYLISMLNIFKYTFIIILLVSAILGVYIMVTRPEFFLVFTNKIYDFIIFHRSGILLYSYNFQTGKEVDETQLKGSILIGINHILANLSNIESQLAHLKMSERAIVFNFKKELGYAALLVAKHKNSILEKAVENFMNKFSQAHGEELKNLTGLIDISKFHNAKDFIHEIFSQYER